MIYILILGIIMFVVGMIMPFVTDRGGWFVLALLSIPFMAIGIVAVIPVTPIDNSHQQFCQDNFQEVGKYQACMDLK